MSRSCSLVAVVALLALGAGTAPVAAAAPASPRDARAAAPCLTKGLGGAGWVAASSAHVRIWALRSRSADVARAHALAALVERRIYGRWTTLLGRTPPGDAGVACPHGGDPRRDGNLAPGGTYAGGTKHLAAGQLGVYRPYSGEPCDPLRPGFIVARAGLDGWVLAHEIYHAFQAAFPRKQHCIWYSEWDEATATWAGDDAFPEIHNVRSHVDALTTPRRFLTSPDGYRAWVYPYLLARRSGRRVLRTLELDAGAYPADVHVDHATPGGLAGFWPTFSLLMINQAPLPGVSVLGASGSSLKQLRGVTAKPTIARRPLYLFGSPTFTLQDPLTPPRGRGSTVNALGRDYRRYVVSDPAIRYLTFQPRLRGGKPTVAALIRTKDGRWHSENWTGRGSISFCRDRPAEDVQEVIVAYGNAATVPEQGTTGTPQVQVRFACPYPKTISGSFNGSLVDGSATITWHGSITFTFIRADPVTHFPYQDAVHYRVTAGSATWTAAPGCSGGGTLGAADLVTRFPTSQIDLEQTPGKGFGVELYAGVSPTTSMPWSCPDGTRGDAAYEVGRLEGALLYNSDSRGPEANRYSTELKAFAGSLSIPGQHWDWTLTGAGSVLPG